MSLESALYSYLTTNIGTVYPVALPENASYPAVCYTISYTPSDHTFDGPQTKNARISIDVYSTAHHTLCGTCESIKTLLDGYKGSIGDFFVISYLDNCVTNPEPFDDGSGQWLYQSTIDFLWRYV